MRASTTSLPTAGPHLGGRQHRHGGSTEDALLVRYRPSGSVAWAQVFDGDDHLDDWFNVVALWGKSSLFAGV